MHPVLKIKGKIVRITKFAVLTNGSIKMTIPIISEPDELGLGKDLFHDILDHIFSCLKSEDHILTDAYIRDTSAFGDIENGWDSIVLDKVKLTIKQSESLSLTIIATAPKTKLGEYDGNSQISFLKPARIITWNDAFINTTFTDTGSFSDIGLGAVTRSIWVSLDSKSVSDGEITFLTNYDFKEGKKAVSRLSALDQMEVGFKISTKADAKKWSIVLDNVRLQKEMDVVTNGTEEAVFKIVEKN